VVVCSFAHLNADWTRKKLGLLELLTADPSFLGLGGVARETRFDRRFDGYCFPIICSVSSSSYLHQTQCWCGRSAESLWRWVVGHSYLYTSAFSSVPRELEGEMFDKNK
jgi:hypothetical protein